MKKRSYSRGHACPTCPGCPKTNLSDLAWDKNENKFEKLRIHPCLWKCVLQNLCLEYDQTLWKYTPTRAHFSISIRAFTWIHQNETSAVPHDERSHGLASRNKHGAYLHRLEDTILPRPLAAFFSMKNHRVSPLLVPTSGNLLSRRSLRTRPHCHLLVIFIEKIETKHSSRTSVSFQANLPAPQMQSVNNQ
jgi:hypothetical protein